MLMSESIFLKCGYRKFSHLFCVHLIDGHGGKLGFKLSFSALLPCPASVSWLYLLT